MARDRSVEGRTRLATTVGDLYVESDLNLSDRERALMTDILDQLIHDVEMTVRHTLAERFAKLPNAPHDLVLKLANDEIDVARPILLESGVLRDQELIDIIHHRSLQHQLSIAMRTQVSEIVSDALVETENTNVIKTLLENSSARIARSTMEYLVNQSRRVNEFQEPLVRREDLPTELAKRMVFWVSAALRKHLLEQHRIDEAELDDILDETVAEEVRQVEKQAKSERSEDVLARQIAREKKITAQMLIDVLRRGEVPLFESLFSQMANIDTEMARRVIYETGGESLAVACRSQEVPKSDFASIFLLSRRARPGDKTVDPHELQKVLSFYDKIKPDAALSVVRRWKREEGYRQAIEDVERGSKPKN